MKGSINSVVILITLLMN